MKMTVLFTAGYAPQAKDDNLRKFTQRCRRFGDRMDTKTLNTKGVTVEEIKEELESGLIKYEPNCGLSRKLSGYSLTAQGIKEVHQNINTY